MERTINKIVRLTEYIENGNDLKKSEILDVLNLINGSNRNLNVYRGILAICYFSKFNRFPDRNFEEFKSNELFLRCLSLLNKGILLSPVEVGDIFLNILKTPDRYGEYRDILMGFFYGALWFFMNDTNNFEKAIEYGITIIKSAFSLDGFDIQKKIKLGEGIQVVSMAGSGKKEVKLLNISSMSAIITAVVGKAIGRNIVVTKTISRTTSSVTGSGDIFELMGVNVNLTVGRMADIAYKTKLGVFDINGITPSLNRVYDGRLHNVQIFAGLVGGAAIVNPVDADLINYGLTRGSTKLCLAILNKLYPKKDIIIIQGKNHNLKPIIDQISIAADTEIAQNIKGHTVIKKVTPKDFGFDFKSFKYIKTKKSSRENLNEFIKVLAGRGNKDLEQTIAMETSVNLFGLGIVNDLTIGANLALEAINSGEGIKVIKDLIDRTNGNRRGFDDLVDNLS